MNYAALSEVREGRARGEMIYVVRGVEHTRTQVERKIEIAAHEGNESEAAWLYAMVNYPVEGIGVGHGYRCGCATCVDARARAWRSR